MSIARRPSARNFTRSSFKSPTRALPQLPANSQKNKTDKKNEDVDDKKEYKHKKRKRQINIGNLRKYQSIFIKRLL